MAHERLLILTVRLLIRQLLHEYIAINTWSLIGGCRGSCGLVETACMAVALKYDYTVVIGCLLTAKAVAAVALSRGCNCIGRYLLTWQLHWGCWVPRQPSGSTLWPHVVLLDLYASIHAFHFKSMMLLHVWIGYLLRNLVVAQPWGQWTPSPCNTPHVSVSQTSNHGVVMAKQSCVHPTLL